MKCKIKEKEYIYTNDILKDRNIISSFMELSKSIFGLNFEQWYNSGYWTTGYIPHVLIDGKNVVSNVSVNIIDVMCKGQIKRYIQLGTIMTAPEYRGYGLSHWLMEKVINEWCNKCECMYLYANDSVVDFYPKFGFVKSIEYPCRKIVAKTDKPIRKLNMSITEDRQLLLDKYQLSNPYSNLTMENNTGLLMFYCSQFMRENIYYLPQEDSIIVADVKNDKIIYYDIFSKEANSLDCIIGVLVIDLSAEVILGFSHKHTEDWHLEERCKEDTTFYVLNGKENIFAKSKMMFPLLSHA